MEKHQLILNELRDKLNLPVDDLNKLSNDELKQSVQSAIGEVILHFKINLVQKLNFNFSQNEKN
jgi:hypothetical protein